MRKLQFAITIFSNESFSKENPYALFKISGNWLIDWLDITPFLSQKYHLRHAHQIVKSPEKDSGLGYNESKII